MMFIFTWRVYQSTFFYDSLQNVNFDKWYQKCILDDMHSFINEDEFFNISQTSSYAAFQSFILQEKRYCYVSIYMEILLDYQNIPFYSIIIDFHYFTV